MCAALRARGRSLLSNAPGPVSSFCVPTLSLYISHQSTTLCTGCAEWSACKAASVYVLRVGTHVSQRVRECVWYPVVSCGTLVCIGCRHWMPARAASNNTTRSANPHASLCCPTLHLTLGSRSARCSGAARGAAAWSGLKCIPIAILWLSCA